MSRTFRTILSLGSKQSENKNLFIEIVDDTAAKHRKARTRKKKMRPYLRFFNGMYEGSLKWEIKDVSGYRFRTGLGARQAAKNFNRHFKKQARQDAKREIHNQLYL